MADPFFYGDQLTISVPVASGTVTKNITVTVSGTAFAEPVITYTAPGTSGLTTTAGIVIEYGPTGEKVTWSGTSTTSLGYGSSVSFDYLNQRILENTSEVDIEGVFARWEPETSTFTTTFSGTAQGGTINMTYSPRYF